MSGDAEASDEGASGIGARAGPALPSWLRRPAGRVRALVPGVMLAAVIAVASGFVSEHHGGPVMLYALLLGMAFHFMADEPRTAAGIGFAARGMLRLGVGLMGARITAEQVGALGPKPPLIVVACVAATIGFGLVAARLMRRHWSFGMLTGGAVAICGASAALAIAAVLPQGRVREKEVLLTVVAVTGLSTVAMVAYPVLFSALGFGAVEAGLLIGATIHDVAQVVGAGYAISDTAGETATLVKLMRVALLPVVVAVLFALSRRGDGGAGVRLPSFLVVFCALAAANSFGLLPAALAAFLSDLSRWLLVTAIAALGMKTTLKDMVAPGSGQIAVTVSITLFLLALAVALVVLI